MGLVVVRHFHDWVEAEASRGLLQAAGLHAVVLDAEQRGVSPTAGWPAMILSYRLAVADIDLAEARSVLGDIDVTSGGVAFDEADFDDSYRWDDLGPEPYRVQNDERIRPGWAAWVVLLGLIGAVAVLLFWAASMQTAG